MSADKNDVVIINLDRPREIRYGHKALKTMLVITGKDLDAIDLNNLDLDELEKYLYCGLLSDALANGETLTLESMEDLLDRAPSFGELIVKTAQALKNAMAAVQGLAPSQGNTSDAAGPKRRQPPKKQ